MSNTPPAAGETGDRTGRYVRHPNGHVAPMSPFADIWRWHMTMVASILFRVTIGAASVGAILLLGWVAAVASGPDAFASVAAFSGSPFGLFIWFGLTLVLFSFLLNGARHLINDAGKGLDIKSANLMAQAVVWGPIVLAVLFWVGLLIFGGGQPAGEFFAGYITEKSLSVDNLFVFVLIMAKFSVPSQYQQRVLLIGVLIALVLRANFIAAGAAR